MRERRSQATRSQLVGRWMWLLQKRSRRRRLQRSLQTLAQRQQRLKQQRKQQQRLKQQPEQRSRW